MTEQKKKNHIHLSDLLYPQLVTLCLVCLHVVTMVSTGRGHMVSKRQVEESQEPQNTGNFSLFGQVIGSFFRLLGTAVEEGGNFLAHQAEANEPVLETVGNISTTIGRSDFVQGVTGGAQCIILCSLRPEGERRKECELTNCGE